MAFCHKKSHFETCSTVQTDFFSLFTLENTLWRSNLENKFSKYFWDFVGHNLQKVRKKFRKKFVKNFQKIWKPKKCHFWGRQKPTSKFQKKLKMYILGEFGEISSRFLSVLVFDFTKKRYGLLKIAFFGFLGTYPQILVIFKHGVLPPKKSFWDLQHCSNRFVTPFYPRNTLAFVWVINWPLTFEYFWKIAISEVPKYFIKSWKEAENEAAWRVVYDLLAFLVSFRVWSKRKKIWTSQNRIFLVFGTCTHILIEMQMSVCNCQTVILRLAALFKPICPAFLP